MKKSEKNAFFFLMDEKSGIQNTFETASRRIFNTSATESWLTPVVGWKH